MIRAILAVLISFAAGVLAAREISISYTTTALNCAARTVPLEHVLTTVECFNDPRPEEQGR